MFGRVNNSEFLLTEMRDARAKYRTLSDQCSTLTRDMTDAPFADGTMASAQLLRKHREMQDAFDVYSDALKRFTQAVLS